LAHISSFFFTLSFGSRTGRSDGLILTIYTSYYDVSLRKEVPFAGSNETAPHFGGQIPQKTILEARIGVFNPKSQTKLAYYRKYYIDSNQILHSDKNHQMPFVGRPNMRITNPTWRKADILEK